MLSLKEIKEEFEAADINGLPLIIKKYGLDGRAGVLKIIEQYENKIKRHEKELKRLNELWKYEREFYDKGALYVAGTDEVGRGPLAGPVMAAAVILPRDVIIPGINDSKKLSEAKREELSSIILKEAVSFGFGIVSPEEIDKINILNATLKAMQKAVFSLSVSPDILLIDALTVPGLKMFQKPIIKGDALSVSIGAASIIAKVKRDALMKEYAKEYPEYLFDKNKGYGTAEHMEAIRKHGLCPIHRKSFLKDFIN
ncbi:MAG: ribonuclease HII [Lachnospiraceae bacterium]|nr:ribonuclease HII [Lachnospiraceae bacterium]